ncbi:hypothetical protein PTI98_006757 [Pleurotus ostreatus]|nr:hypothetical protein PTI98_006757 [Pleurotus ostreatus]
MYYSGNVDALSVIGLTTTPCLLEFGSLRLKVTALSLMPDYRTYVQATTFNEKQRAPHATLGYFPPFPDHHADYPGGVFWKLHCGPMCKPFKLLSTIFASLYPT